MGGMKWRMNNFKADRRSKTVYTYEDGTEIEVSDGRTYIEVSDVSMNVNIE